MLSTACLTVRVCEEIENRWIGALRPSTRPLRGLLRMRKDLNAINGIPHGEVARAARPRTTHGADAAFYPHPARVLLDKLVSSARRPDPVVMPQSAGTTRSAIFLHTHPMGLPPP